MKTVEYKKQFKPEPQKELMAKVVFTTTFAGKDIRIVKYEDKLWLLSLDMRKALNILHGGSFCEKAPEEVKRAVYFEGFKKVKRIISPEGLNILADKSVRGKIFRYRHVIKEFVKKLSKEDPDNY